MAEPERVDRPDQPLPDQPDGLDSDSYELPDPSRAAERILAYVASFGDGLYDELAGNPLYGRDLESVAKAATKYAEARSALEEARAEVRQQKANWDAARQGNMALLEKFANAVVLPSDWRVSG